MSFSPYLFFSGNCREAMTRYHEIFGGEIFVMRMGDAPDTGDLPPEKADLVIHAAVMIDGGMLMASDDPMTDGPITVSGIQVSVSPQDRRRSQPRVRRARRRRPSHPTAHRDVLLARVRHVRRPLRHAVDDLRRRPQRAEHEHGAELRRRFIRRDLRHPAVRARADSLRRQVLDTTASSLPRRRVSLAS